MPAPSPTRHSESAPHQHVLGRWLYSQSATGKLLRRAIAALAIVLGLAYLRGPIGALAPEHIYQYDIVQGYTMARAMAGGVPGSLSPQITRIGHLISFSRVVRSIFGIAWLHPA